MPKNSSRATPAPSSPSPTSADTPLKLGDQSDSESNDAPHAVAEPPAGRRANDLSGADWTRNSISVWSDIRFTSDERKLKHPAMFPVALVERLIQCFTTKEERVILEPFVGSGSTLVAAKNLGKTGVGFEIYPKFIDVARSRLSQDNIFQSDDVQPTIHNADARHISELVEANSVDFCVTSPPYWDILTQRRTADYKKSESYGEHDSDLGIVHDYEAFLLELQQVFRGVLHALRPGKYCVVNVMDLRKKDRFFPFHADLARKLQEIGFLFDDIIIWDRRADYNNLRSLGYPYVFRVNKIHEFLLIFQKPRDAKG